MDKKNHYAVNWEHQGTKPSYSFARLQNDQRRLLLFVFLVRRRPLSREKGAGKGKNLHWKLRQQSWNSPAPFRDYDLDHIVFRNKTFLFFKIESWNFQQLFEKEFHFNSIRQQIEKMKITIVWMSWMSWNFVRFHKILFQTDAESFNFLSWKKKIFLKKYFLGRCQYQNKKALFTDPIFSEGFGLQYITFHLKLFQT